jgi:hypothetical protein
MAVTVQPDRILFGIGADFVPRFLDLPQVLQVPAGQVVTLPPTSTWDYIEVAGTLKISHTTNTTVRFTHLYILPGGHLDAGTEADPIPANITVEFIVRDVPIDMVRDPFQWGNGLLNFGRQDRCGAPKLAWTTLLTDTTAGATTVILAEDPAGWQVGDELLLPDTGVVPLGISDQPENLPRRESPVTVAGLNGRTITLSKPLDFEHLAQLDPDGHIMLLPRVANLTRNVRVYSEQSAGVRGHTANVGPGATWSVCYTQMSDLGRTTVDVLDSTSADLSHVGTNQVGRYMEHEHHAQGFGSVSRGNVLRGGAKWGMAVHLTHDALVEWNIALDLPGAGFVTEDGPETRNTFRKNFAAYIFGNMPNVANDDMARQNVDNNQPGVEGSGFWWRGVRNTYEGNEAWNDSVGMNLFNFLQNFGDYPSTPGGMADTPFDNDARVVATPFTFKGNVTASNVIDGLEYWGTSRFLNEDHVSTYNGAAEVFTATPNPISAYFKNPLFVGKDGQGIGIDAQFPYTFRLDIEGGKILGHAIGLNHGGAQTVTITGTVMANVLDFDWTDLPPAGFVLTDVLFQPLLGLPLRVMIFGRDDVWPGPPTPLPVVGLSHFAVQQGSQYVLKNWQGTGKDYLLYSPQSFGSALAWPSGFDQTQSRWNVPEDGLTNQQARDKYGMSYNGAMLPDALAVKLDGIEVGLAKAGLDEPLGPPRSIITVPRMGLFTEIEPARDENGPFITARGIFTGTNPSGLAHVSIDGGPVFEAYVSPFGDPDVYEFRVYALSPLTHEIHTWVAADTEGHDIPGSEMVFRYVVGAPPLPPPPPLPARVEDGALQGASTHSTPPGRR